jgi:RNA polymerase sigma factor (sigma-70 family)
MEMFAALSQATLPDRARFADRAKLEEAAALRPLVKAVIAAVLGEGREHPDVEDCTHETLRRAMEGRSRLRDGEPLRPWVVGIARHVALDARRERFRTRARLVPVDAADSTPAIDRAPDPAPGPFDRLADLERGRKVRGLIDRLPDGQRTALTLFHLEGLAYGQIAQRMGVPLGTVATWVARGRQTIAESLKEEDL